MTTGSQPHRTLRSQGSGGKNGDENPPQNLTEDEYRLRVAPGQDPLPSKEELLARHPDWTDDREIARETGRPWLTPSLRLIDARSGWRLPGCPRAFKKGRSGNPKGPPRRPSLVRELSKLLRNNRYLQTALAVRLLQEALGSSPKALDAIKVALDRMDGPVKQELDVVARQLEEGITLHERSRPVPLPGLEENNSQRS